jgi:lipoyl(octanoyl) transferase
MHGWGFNVNSNLDYFNNIIPCGIQDKAVTSLNKELGQEVDLIEVKQKLKKHFSQLFDCTLITD